MRAVLHYLGTIGMAQRSAHQLFITAIVGESIQIEDSLRSMDTTIFWQQERSQLVRIRSRSVRKNIIDPGVAI